MRESSPIPSLILLILTAASRLLRQCLLSLHGEETTASTAANFPAITAMSP
jgi:hypothetical protein